MQLHSFLFPFTSLPPIGAGLSLKRGGRLTPYQALFPIAPPQPRRLFHPPTPSLPRQTLFPCDALLPEASTLLIVRGAQARGVNRPPRFSQTQNGLISFHPAP